MLQAHIKLEICLAKVSGGNAMTLHREASLLDPFTVDTAMHQSIGALPCGIARSDIHLRALRRVTDSACLMSGGHEQVLSFWTCCRIMFGLWLQARLTPGQQHLSDSYQGVSLNNGAGLLCGGLPQCSPP